MNSLSAESRPKTRRIAVSDPPGNREDEGERQDVGDKGKKKLQRHIVIDEERQEFAKDIADHEDEAQHRDREEHVNNQLAADETVDQLHGSVGSS